jgi:uncharacterized Fe-S center protein
MLGPFAALVMGRPPRAPDGWFLARPVGGPRIHGGFPTKPLGRRKPMPATVYFAASRTRSNEDSKLARLARLCDALGLKKILKKNDLAAVKLHFGEYGNDTHLNPTLVRQVVDKVLEAGAKPFLTDTTTLYSGTRHNAVDHLNTAYRHGFAPSVVGAPVILADGLYGENDVPVRINAKHFKTVHIATEIRRAPAMVVLSHFKGHEMAGFGGAIKNLAMGGAAVRGKREQHATLVSVTAETCIGCGKCVKVCPQQALSLHDNKSVVDKERCIGCFECMTVCPVKAISLDWATEIVPFMERLTEYAYGAVKGQGQAGLLHQFCAQRDPGLRLRGLERPAPGAGRGPAGFHRPRGPGPGLSGPGQRRAPAGPGPERRAGRVCRPLAPHQGRGAAQLRRGPGSGQPGICAQKRLSRLDRGPARARVFWASGPCALRRGLDRIASSA